MQNYSVDFVITKKFDNKFSKIKCTNFVSKILFNKLKAKYIFVSNNFRFGNKRKGDVNELKKNEKKFNYKIVKPNPLTTKNKIISNNFFSIGKDPPIQAKGIEVIKYGAKSLIFKFPALI